MARKVHRGRSSSTLIFKIAASVLTAWSLSAPAAIYCIAHDTSDYLQDPLNVRAQTAIEEGERYLQAPSINVLRLLNASTNWQDRGQMNFGIFEITTPDGGDPVALKIVDGDQFLVRNPQTGLLVDFSGEMPSGAGAHLSSAAFREYIDVHSLLGELHVAPRLIAVLNARSLKTAFRSQWEAMKEIAEKFEFSSHWLDKPRFRGSQAIGVIMQKLPRAPEQGPLHPINRAPVAHPFMSQWTSDNLVRVVRDMIEIRRRVITAGVQAIDQQFAVTPSAKAYLIDLDQARFNSHDPFLDISYEILKVIVQWEAVSGQRLPDLIRYQLLDEATLPYAVCRSDDDFKDMLQDWRCEDFLKSR